MKNIFTVLLVLIISTSLYAQRGGRIDREQLEAAKIAFITTRLDLTPSQAEKFWPIFNEFTNQRESTLKTMAALSDGSDDSSEEEAKAKIQKRFELQQKLIQDEKVFVDKASTAISYNQIFKLNRINRDFTRQLYQRQRRPPGGN